MEGVWNISNFMDPQTIQKLPFFGPPYQNTLFNPPPYEKWKFGDHQYKINFKHPHIEVAYWRPLIQKWTFFESPIYIICKAKLCISFNENFDKKGFCLFDTVFLPKNVFVQKFNPRTTVNRQFLSCKIIQFLYFRWWRILFTFWPFFQN